jgi:hypothetical protein
MCFIAQMKLLPHDQTAHSKIIPEQLMHSLGQKTQEQGWESNIAESAIPEILLSGQWDALSPIEGGHLSSKAMHSIDGQLGSDRFFPSTTLV